MLASTLLCASEYVSDPPVGLEMVCGESAEAARTTRARLAAAPVTTPAMVSDVPVCDHVPSDSLTSVGGVAMTPALGQGPMPRWA